MVRRRRKRRFPVVPWLLVLTLCLIWNAAAMIHDHVKSGKAWLGDWDSNFYFAWSRSLAVDGDWDFDNDVAFVGSLAALGDTARQFQAYRAEGNRTNSGRVPNKYACGIGILALPWLLLARFGLGAFSFAGLTAQPDPFSSLYVFAFIGSGVVWGVLGLAVALALMRREYSPGVSWTAVGAGAIGLSLGYYIWFEPAMAHATGFGVATLYLLCVRNWADRTTLVPERPAAWRRWAFLMGLAFGMACLVRFTNIALALAPLVIAWALRFPSGAGQRSWLSVMMQSLGMASLGSAIGFLPQLIAWKIVYGAFIVDSYSGSTFSSWPRHLLLVLFGPRNGLFSWTPLALVAVLGLVLGARRNLMCRAGLVVLAAMAWLYGSWDAYWLGHSFGMRGFVDVSFFLLLGLAEVLRRTDGVPLRWASRVLLMLPLLWTVHLIVCYRAQIQPHGEPLAVGPILTEWKRWGEQVRKDTGLDVLIK